MFCLIFLCSCSAVQQLFDNSGVEVQIGSNPAGITDLKSGTLMTLTESKPISSNSLNIKLPKTENKNTTSLVAAKFGDELRLIDFVIPSVNDKPKLDFESTARSLIFMNPLFLGLPFEARVAIFKDIPKHSGFEALKQKVTLVTSLSDKDLIQAEMEIALDIAKQKGILIAATATPNAKPASNPSQPSPKSTAPQTSFDQEKFPKAACGDQLPSDPKAYPLDVYPVFADYSEKNFQVITTQFCQDAIRRIRKDTNKEAIQIGTFISKDRAEAFKSFLQKKIGKTEVGKSTRIDSKRSSLPTNSLSDWFAEPANAQNANQSATNLEYKLNRQFNHDFELRGYPYHHGYELQATSDGIKIVGGSILAQQVIVVPKDKVKQQNLTNDDYGGKKLLDQDVVAELLLQPQQIGIWDGTVFTTVGGGSRTEQSIAPKDGGRWKHGDYTVIISAGPKLNRTSDKQLYGAFNINIANEVTDLLTMVGAIPLKEDNIKKAQEVITNLGAIGSDCYTSKDDYQELLTCLQKADNMVKISGAAGFENEDILKQAFKMTADRDWNKLAKVGEQVAKFGGKVLKIFDSSVSLSRQIVLGQYLSRENKDGLYSAEISIIDPVVEAMSPKTFEVDPCGRKTEILDMEIRVGSSDCINQSILSVRNYSNNVVEITFENGYRFLIAPNNFISGSQYFSLRGLGNTDTFKWNANKKVPLNVQKLDTRFPERNITFSCDNKNLPDIWGIRIDPKCLETGTYADYTNSSRFPIDVILGDSTLRLDPSKSLNWPEGNLRSNTRTVTIKIRANFN
jgi:hypothetical protein